jgi:hypothetical protein
MLDMVNRESSSPNGKSTRKTWKMMIVDSLIIGLVALAAVLPGTVPNVGDAWVMFKAFFIAFVFQVAVERGLKRAPPSE